MADSASLRKRRHRLHKAGDHSLCRPERCPEAAAPTRAETGELEAALGRYLDSLSLDEADPRSLVAAVAVRVARSLDHGVTAAMAKELRACLADLAEGEQDDGGQAERLLLELRGLMR